jgi:hypothetical protein
MSKPKPKPPLEITELSQLEKLSHGEPIIVDLQIRKATVRLIGRRLKPSESKEVKLLLERALPPVLPAEREGGQPRYDFRDPNYLRSAEEDRRVARALAIYSAFPIFKQALQKEGEALDNKRIVEFIEGREMDDDILDLLFNRVTERIVGVAPYVGFI